jgi:hypothetical protein
MQLPMHMPIENPARVINKAFCGHDTYDYNPSEHHGFTGQHGGLFNEILQRFKNCDGICLVKDLLPQSLENSPPERITLLRVDLSLVLKQ